MTQRGLFDVPEPSPASMPPLPESRAFATAGVLRVIQPKAGPFRVLKEGGQLTGREFQILEMEDGRYLWRFTDNGELAPATKATTSFFVGDMISGGVWVEVKA